MAAIRAAASSSSLLNSSMLARSPAPRQDKTAEYDVTGGCGTYSACVDSMDESEAIFFRQWLHSAVSQAPSGSEQIAANLLNCVQAESPKSRLDAKMMLLRRRTDDLERELGLYIAEAKPELLEGFLLQIPRRYAETAERFLTSVATRHSSEAAAAAAEILRTPRAREAAKQAADLAKPLNTGMWSPFQLLLVATVILVVLGVVLPLEPEAAAADSAFSNTMSVLALAVAVAALIRDNSPRS